MSNFTAKVWRQLKADPVATLKKIALRSTRCRFLSDELALRIKYRALMGSRLDLDNPKSFNEKLQWLKLHDHNPLYTTLVDKYAVKSWVSKRIGDEYVTQTLAVWKSAGDIDIADLPDRFVLKTNHDSGGVVICRDKSTFDLVAAKKKLAASMKRNYFYASREWPYKDVKPLVFAEEYLDPDESANGDLRDYKVMCFDGDPRLIQVHAGRHQGGHTQDIYDSSWNRTDITQVGLPMSLTPDEKPEFLEEVLELSKMLSSGMTHVRVDWFMTKDGLRFGEMTFYDAAGFEAFDDYADDLKLGSWIELPCGGGWLNVTDSLVVSVLPEPESTPHEMTDYKFYCFDGEPKFLYVSQGLENHETARISFLETDWGFAPFRRGDYAPFEELPQKPASYDEMLGLARKLSEGIPFVRADFFEYKGKPRFSEMTFSPCAGYMPFEPQEWDLRVGEMLAFPN